MTDRTNITVIGMGYVGIPMAALLADVEGFYVTGIQRRSQRSGWKIDCLNEGKNCFEGDEPGLDELIERVVKNEKFHVVDNYEKLQEADYILIDVQTPVDDHKVPRYESLKDVSKLIAPKIRKGGHVILHDWNMVYFTGVIAAAAKYFKSFPVEHVNSMAVYAVKP